MDSPFCHTPSEVVTPAPGPLSGRRVALQPNISVAGWPAEAGSRALAGFTALEDATVVRRLREAGAILCGATRMSEFGFGLAGSQAGRAVQEGAADAELVLDEMGECRLAALGAGACGFKPSYGLVSQFGVIGLAPSMEGCGILAGDPSAIRDILAHIAGPDEMDLSLPDAPLPAFAPWTLDPRECTIGVVSEALATLPARATGDFRAALEDLGAAGFPLREVSFPELPLCSLVHQIVGAVEASSSAGRYDSVRYGPRAPGAKNWNEMYLRSRGAAFGPLIKSCLFQGAYFQFERYDAYEDACRIRARLVGEMQRLAAVADVLVLPAVCGAALGEPAPLADTCASFATTVFANVTGQPALCLTPASGGGAAGLQFTGPRLGDARLLALGEYLANRRRGGN